MLEAPTTPVRDTYVINNDIEGVILVSSTNSSHELDMFYIDVNSSPAESHNEERRINFTYGFTLPFETQSLTLRNSLCVFITSNGLPRENSENLPEHLSVLEHNPWVQKLYRMMKHGGLVAISRDEERYEQYAYSLTALVAETLDPNGDPESYFNMILLRLS